MLEDGALDPATWPNTGIGRINPDGSEGSCTACHVRRARHGAAMMGPDYTHWHGTYEVAKNFYTEMVPELEELVEHGRHSKDAAKNKAAERLATKLSEVLESENHRWYVGKLDPAEAARRKKAAEDFKARYKD